MCAVIRRLYAIVVAFVHGVSEMQRGNRGLAVSIVRTSAIRLRSGRLSIEEHQTRMYFPLADKEVMGIGSTVLCSPLNIGLTSKLMLRLLLVGDSSGQSEPPELPSRYLHMCMLSSSTFDVSGSILGSRLLSGRHQFVIESHLPNVYMADVYA